MSTDQPYIRLEADWNAFLGRALFTFVEGEVSSPADSGYAFARRARDILGIPEERILHPSDVLSILTASETSGIRG